MLPLEAVCICGWTVNPDRNALRAIYERFGFRLHSYRDVGPYHLSRYEYVIGQP